MPGAAVNQGTGRLAIRAGRAFDGCEMIPGGALVLCAGGRIVGVEPATAPAPDGWPVAEFPGATVLPGMIDVTSIYAGFPQRSPGPPGGPWRRRTRPGYRGSPARAARSRGHHRAGPG